MKFNYIILSLFLTAIGFAQPNFNQFSLEGAVGYSKPFSPYLDKYNSSFAGFTNVNIGVRYMFNEDYGLRLEYVKDRFENTPGGEIGTVWNRVGVQGIYNLGRLLDIPYATYDKIGLLVHAGVGYTRAKPIAGGDTERIGTFAFGVTPQLRLTNGVVLFTDLSSMTNFKQHYNFDGSHYSNKPDTPTVGYHVNVSFGIMIYLGQKRYHADWF